MVTGRGQRAEPGCGHRQRCRAGSPQLSVLSSPCPNGGSGEDGRLTGLTLGCSGQRSRGGAGARAAAAGGGEVPESAVRGDSRPLRGQGKRGRARAGPRGPQGPGVGPRAGLGVLEDPGTFVDQKPRFGCRQSPGPTRFPQEPDVAVVTRAFSPHAFHSREEPWPQQPRYQTDGP